MGLTALPIIMPISVSGSSLPPAWNNSIYLTGAPFQPTVTGSRKLGSIGTYANQGVTGGVAYICSNDPTLFGCTGPIEEGFINDFTWNTRSVALTDNAGTGSFDYVTASVASFNGINLATNQSSMMCGPFGFVVNLDDGAGHRSGLNLGINNGFVFQFNNKLYLQGFAYSAIDSSGTPTYNYATEPRTGFATPSGTLTFSGSFGAQFNLYAQAGAPTWTATVVGTGW